MQIVCGAEQATLALICVNYNSEKPIASMLRSIVLNENINITVIIADNSGSLVSSKYHEEIVSYNFVRAVFPNSNLGYFGAAQYILDKFPVIKNARFLAIVNPDIRFSVDFFNTLLSTEYGPHIGIIAPAVVNCPSGNPANPFMTSRPSRVSMWIKMIAHSTPFFFWGYNFLHRAKQRFGVPAAENSFPAGGIIYAPHGSLILFRPTYFQNGGDFTFPGFLFGEEIFVAEEAIRAKLQIRFDRKLVAEHDEHVSTSTVGNKKLARYAFRSLRSLYRKYF